MAKKKIETTIKHDCYGHCVVCHEDMRFEQVVDGKLTKRLSPRYRETAFLLNNGSRMRVAICKDCLKEELDNEAIMTCVMNGWEVESESLLKNKNKPDWDKKKKDEYIDGMKKLTIVCNADNKNKQHLEDVFVKYKKEKVVKDKGVK